VLQLVTITWLIFFSIWLRRQWRKRQERKWVEWSLRPYAGLIPNEKGPKYPSWWK
jgi:hypothetical protein